MTYFAPEYNFTLWTGILAFVLLSFFAGLIYKIPYIGQALLPVAWEWWWLDISINEVSGLAWVLAVLSLANEAILFFIVVRSGYKSGVL